MLENGTFGIKGTIRTGHDYVEPASHARDASLLERRVKKSPRRFAAQAPARVLLARE